MDTQYSFLGSLHLQHFILWNDSVNNFEIFLAFLNNNEIGLKFTYEIDNCMISSLDLLIIKESHQPISLKRGLAKKAVLPGEEKQFLTEGLSTTGAGVTYPFFYRESILKR